MAELTRAMAEAARPIDFTTCQEIDWRVKQMFSIDWDDTASDDNNQADVELSEEMATAQNRKREIEEGKKRRTKPETGREAYLRIKSKNEKKENKKIKKDMKRSVQKKEQSSIRMFFKAKK